MKLQRFIVALLLLVAACADKVKETPPPERLYNEAVAAAQSGGLFGGRDCYEVERKVEQLRQYYPYHSATLDGELLIADCAFAEKRTEEAIGRWESFLRFYPSHRRAVEVWMQLARAYKSQYDDYDRDLGAVKQALNAASTLIRDYPTSVSAGEGTDIHNWAREILAKREYYVARHYRRSGDLLSAKGRLESLIQMYPETTVIAEARSDLEKIVKRLNFPALQ